MRSRTPKSTAQHKADGTYQKSRHRDRVEQPPVSGNPLPPPDFTERQTYWWNHYVRDISGFTTLTEPHLNAVALLCRLTVEREILEAEIQANGHTFRTDSGQLKINPAFTARMAVDNQIIKLFEQFGFTLRSSMNLKVEKPKTTSKILELMAGGKTKAG
jgi:P27 family predicted phage terminase small subunit